MKLRLVIFLSSIWLLSTGIAFGFGYTYQGYRIYGAEVANVVHITEIKK